MGDTSETNTKVLYRELFLGVVALKTPIPQNHYLRDKVPFLKSGHIYINACIRTYIHKCMHTYIHTYMHILEKWFPLQGEQGHSSYFLSFQKQNREEGETE